MFGRPDEGLYRRFREIFHLENRSLGSLFSLPAYRKLGKELSSNGVLPGDAFSWTASLGFGTTVAYSGRCCLHCMTSKTLFAVLAYFPGIANHRAVVSSAFETRRTVFKCRSDDG